MLVQWLNNNDIKKIDFNMPLFPAATNRKFWNDKCDTSVVAEAEKYLKYEWPMIRATDFLELAASGSRKKQEVPHFARRKALINLVVGEIMEYKGRFLPDIVDGIFAICEETFWGLSAHMAVKDLKVPHIPPHNVPCIDLFAAETAELISVTYYMLYEALADYCPDLIERIEYELETRIVKPYLEHEDWPWMGTGDWINNWNPWIIANLLTVFLSLKPRDEVFYRGVAKAMIEINRYYRSLPSDGGCDEGSSYWLAGAGKFFEFCDQLYISTKGNIDVFNDTKMKKIATFGYSSYIGNGLFIPFADYNPGFGNAEYIYYMFGRRVGDDAMVSFAKDYSNMRLKVSNGNPMYGAGKIKQVLWWWMYKSEILKGEGFVPQKHICFPILQIAIHRNNSWYYAIKGGHNDENHNHNDVGGFVVYHNNLPLLIDPGCPVYTAQTHSSGRYEIWTMRSEWHNLPMFNNVQQSVGKQYMADVFEDKENSTEVSFAKTYDAESCANVVKRVITLNDNGISLADAFEFSNENTSVYEQFVTPLSVSVENNAVILGDKYCFSTEHNCEISVESMDISDDAKLLDLWKVERLNRVRFAFFAKSSDDINFVLKEK